MSSNPVPLLNLTVSILVIAAAIPLALGRVPMNRWYGIRTRNACGSIDEWYRVNRIGGRRFIACATGLGALSIAMLVNQPLNRLLEPVAPWLALVFLVPAVSMWSPGERP